MDAASASASRLAAACGCAGSSAAAARDVVTARPLLDGRAVSSGLSSARFLPELGLVPAILGPQDPERPIPKPRVLLDPPPPLIGRIGRDPASIGMLALLFLSMVLDLFCVTALSAAA